MIVKLYAEILGSAADIVPMCVAQGGGGGGQMECGG